MRTSVVRMPKAPVVSLVSRLRYCLSCLFYSMFVAIDFDSIVHKLKLLCYLYREDIRYDAIMRKEAKRVRNTSSREILNNPNRITPMPTNPALGALRHESPTLESERTILAFLRSFSTVWRHTMGMPYVTCMMPAPTSTEYMIQLRTGQFLRPKLTNEKSSSLGEIDEIGGEGVEGRRRCIAI
jgi:hypothetical protein